MTQSILERQVHDRNLQHHVNSEIVANVLARQTSHPIIFQSRVDNPQKRIRLVNPIEKEDAPLMRRAKSLSDLATTQLWGEDDD